MRWLLGAILTLSFTAQAQEMCCRTGVDNGHQVFGFFEFDPDCPKKMEEFYKKQPKPSFPEEIEKNKEKFVRLACKLDKFDGLGIPKPVCRPMKGSCP